MSQKRTYEEAVAIVVEWWIQKSFDTPMNQDNGDTSDIGWLGYALMNMLSESVKEKVSPESKKRFEQKLTDILLSKKSGFESELRVDYHPCKALHDACDFAGINTSCLPIKTFTRIGNDNIITGKYQYGGEWFEI